MRILLIYNWRPANATWPDEGNELRVYDAILSEKDLLELMKFAGRELSRKEQYAFGEWLCAGMGLQNPILFDGKNYDHIIFVGF